MDGWAWPLRITWRESSAERCLLWGAAREPVVARAARMRDEYCILMGLEWCGVWIFLCIK